MSNRYRSGATRLASKTTSGAFLDSGAIGSLGSLSADGRYVAFESDASNLPGGTDTTDAYLHDVKTGTTRLMSRTTAGTPADGDSDTVSVSSNGRYVAFESDADNIGGVSGFIAPDGTVTEKTALFTADQRVADPVVRTERTPADRLGAVPEWVAAAALVLLLVGSTRAARSVRVSKPRPLPDATTEDGTVD